MKNDSEVSIRPFEHKNRYEVAKISTQAFGIKVGNLKNSHSEKLEKMFLKTLDTNPVLTI
jgi:hypothetical protein